MSGTTGGTSDGRFIAEICNEVVEFGPVNATIHSSTSISISPRSSPCARSPAPLARLLASLNRTLRDWLTAAERRLRAARLQLRDGPTTPATRAAWLLTHVLRISHEELARSQVAS